MQRCRPRDETDAGSPVQHSVQVRLSLEGERCVLGGLLIELCGPLRAERIVGYVQRLGVMPGA
jgi:hypothetical protein